MKPTLKPCRCCRGTGVEKTFQEMKPKLTYTMGEGGELASIGSSKIGIFRTFTGGYVALINQRELPGSPVYDSSDAAKLAAERAVLEMAKTVVEILS